MQTKENRSDDASETQEGGTQDAHEDISLESFQKVVGQQHREKQVQENREVFDGYALRDVIYEKWNYCYDVEFNRVDSFGFRCFYLNILPFYSGGRRFRHETELEYLCHLQAVVEILEKYYQVCHVGVHSSTDSGSFAHALKSRFISGRSATCLSRSSRPTKTPWRHQPFSYCSDMLGLDPGRSHQDNWILTI